MQKRNTTVNGYTFQVSDYESTNDIQRFLDKTARLYEQSPSAPEGAELVGYYVKRWMGGSNEA